MRVLYALYIQCFEIVHEPIKSFAFSTRVLSLSLLCVLCVLLKRRESLMQRVYLYPPFRLISSVTVLMSPLDSVYV